MTLLVRRAGPLTLVQDAGRPGYAHLGVGRSGAADLPALVRANALVGNAPHTAALEVALGGLVAVASEPVTVAVTGARCPLRVDDRPVPHATPVAVPAGGVLRLDPTRTGLRAYLAVAGGIAVEAVLGSRATDTLSGLGPPVVRGGTELPVGPAPDGPRSATPAAEPDLPTEPDLRVVPGPRADWFAPDVLDALCGAAWTATPASNRVGVRLDGPVLPRRVTDELPSEGLVAGAVQVPPGGGPVLFLADHPVTGGYPVLAVVDPADLWLAAQARPGQTLHFRT